MTALKMLGEQWTSATMAVLFLFVGVVKSTAQTADPATYLAPVIQELQKDWPTNHAITIVFHGHSVPAGYFKTPVVDSLHAYPNLVRMELAKRFHHAVINVIVTAIGGENSVKGAERFERDVLKLRPDMLFIDYSLNDRAMGLEKPRQAWEKMIQMATTEGAKVILLTPTPDQSAKMENVNDSLNLQGGQVRRLSEQFKVGLVDSLATFKTEIAQGKPLASLMSQVNHPNAKGHELVAAQIMKWFPSTVESIK